MGTISVSLPSDGTTADVADYNTPITTIVNEFNGGIDNDNIDASAAIAGSKLADAAVTPSKWTNPYKFAVYRSAAANTGNAAYALVSFDTEEFDSNSNFAAGVYTVPVAGFYQFNSEVNFAAGTTCIVAIFKDGVEFKRGDQGSSPGGYSVSSLIQCDAGDVIDIRAFGNAANALGVGQALTWFNGYLVSQT